MGGGSKTIKTDKQTQDAEARIAGAYRDDFDKFQKDTMPIVQEQVDSLSDNSMVQQSLDDNVSRNRMTEQGGKRNLARYGVGFTGGQRESLSKRMKMSSSATDAGNINNARLAQTDRNENVAMSLSGQGSAYRGQALSEMGQAVNMGTNRAVGNAQSASAAKSANIGTAMSLATMAMSV